MVHDMSGPALTCWVISDGRQGIENQALGLAESISHIQPLDIFKHVMATGKAFTAASPKMQLKMRSDPAKYGLEAPYPSVAIGCGRQAIAPLLALKQKVPSVFTIYVQDPRIAASNFDLVIAPEHDGLVGPNVISMIGSPNRINNTELIANVLAFSDSLEDLPMPRVAMLIGGDSSTHKMTKTAHVKHMKAATDVLGSGRSVMITTSRRTPDWAVTEFEKLARDNEDVWFYQGGDPNPYMAFLGSAETIMVTEDSTNMLTEACTTGKHVFTLPMEGNPGKFKTLYDELAKQCHMRPYETVFRNEPYKALNETARVAALVKDRLQAVIKRKTG